MNYKEFAAAIKEQNPEFADRDDLELAREMVKKYPVYEDDVTFDLDLDPKVATQDVLQTPGLPKEQNGLEDPFAAAKALSERDNIPLSKAREIIAGFPRSSRASLQGETFSPMATIGDVFSSVGRGIYGALDSEDPLTSMGRIDPKPFTAEGEERGFLSMMGEGMLRDPSLPMTPFTGSGALTLASKIPALMTGSRAANVGRNALAGGMASIGETFIEQQTRPEGYPMLSLGEYATIGGLGSGMGGAMGAFQKARPKIETPQTIMERNVDSGIMEQVPNPDAIKVDSPVKQQKAYIKEAEKIKDLGTISGVDVESINPNLRQDFFSPLGPKDIPYDEYLKAAQSKVNPNLKEGAPRARSSLEFAVDKVAGPAFESYKKATQKIGKEIGEMRDALLPTIPEISKDKLISMVNGSLASEKLKFTRNFTEDGAEVFSLVDVTNGKSRPISGLYKNILGAIKSIDGEVIDGSDLRYFHTQIRDEIPKDMVSSQNVITEATLPIRNIEKMTRSAIDEAIEGTAGESVANHYKKLRSQYGPMRKNVIELGKQLGGDITFTPKGDIKIVPEKGFKKGEGAVSRILQSKQSQGAKFLWDDVKRITGYDVHKAAAFALQAGEAVDDYTTKSLLDEMGKVNKAIKAMPKDLSNRTVFGTTAEVLKWTGDKVKKWHDEYRNPAQGRGVRAAAEMEEKRRKARFQTREAEARLEDGYQVPNMNLGMFTGRGIVDQPTAESAIFPYMLGEENNETY